MPDAPCASALSHGTSMIGSATKRGKRSSTGGGSVASPPVVSAQPKSNYNFDAAARVAYIAFVRGAGFKIGQKVSDASGVHRIPAWDDHKTFVKERWLTIAKAVVAAALGDPSLKMRKDHA